MAKVSNKKIRRNDSQIFRSPVCVLPPPRSEDFIGNPRKSGLFGHFLRSPLVNLPPPTSEEMGLQQRYPEISNEIPGSPPPQNPSWTSEDLGNSNKKRSGDFHGNLRIFLGGLSWFYKRSEEMVLQKIRRNGFTKDPKKLNHQSKILIYDYYIRAGQ